jgi:hypothetical protein
MDSIHVKASTVERWAAVLRWVWPVVSIAMTTVAGFGFRWVLSRTSIEDVAPLIAKSNIAAAEAQSSALHCSSLAEVQSAQLTQITKMLLDTWAIAEVDRAYSKSPRRSEYIDSARKFFAREYSDQLERHANDPARALELARAAEWRPDR